MGVQLTDDEIAAFLDGAVTGILTTLRRDGSPVALPVWFVLLDGVVYVRTLAASAKMRRLRNDPRVGFLVEDGEAWVDLRAVVLSGTATEIEDPELCERIDAALDRKYADLAMPSSAPAATKDHYGAGVAFVRIDPDRSPLSWHNRKIRTVTR